MEVHYRAPKGLLDARAAEEQRAREARRQREEERRQVGARGRA